MKPVRFTKAILAWCLYDSACASFPVIITTFIFATYFTTKVAANPILGTYQWANATSLAGIIIAILGPLIGAIADYGGHHKRWLFFFTMISIVSAGLLWFAYPNTSSVHFTLALLVCGTVGLEIALIFYNAFLPELSSKENTGRISGWGWGCGYLGGIIALSFALWIVSANSLGLDVKTAAQIRICGPFVALWYFLLSLPLFFIVPLPSSLSYPLPKAIRIGCKQLIMTLKKIGKEKNILWYFFSHMIYTDGLNTLFAFGGIYAAGTYGLTFEEVLLFGISMNITAGLGAISLAWMDDYWGSKNTILISLFFLTLCGIPLLFLHHKYIFWGVALLLCIFVGPVQSASRSLMVHLITDKKTTTEMFGLYSLSGKITAFLGPWFLGWLTLFFNSQRVGMSIIILFFILGALTLLPVRVKVEL